MSAAVPQYIHNILMGSSCRCRPIFNINYKDDALALYTNICSTYIGVQYNLIWMFWLPHPVYIVDSPGDNFRQS